MLVPLLLATQAWAGKEFLTNMRKAEKVKEDPDKVEFYTRAIGAWEPGDDKALLAECQFRRGEAHFRLYQLAEAEQDLSKAVEADPGNAQAELLRGRTRLRMGHAEGAAKDFGEYTILAPEDEQGWLWLGQARLKDGRLPQALVAFAKAQKLEPGDFRPWLGEGRVRLAQRDWDKAEAALSRADELARRKSPEALTELAVCEVGRGRQQQALSYYDEALPLHEAALEKLMRGGELEAEIAEARDQAARAYYGRGRINEVLVRLKEALSDFQRACDLGHEAGCKWAGLLAAKPAEAEPKRPSAKPAVAPTEGRGKPPKKKKLPPPQSEPGERIYAN